MALTRNVRRVSQNDDMLDRQYSASSKVLFSVATTSKLTAHPSSRNARSALAQKCGVRPCPARAL
jgi:hypothetical protein